MSFGTSLLSKVIEANDPSALLRYGLTRNDFQTDGERCAFEYINNYAEKNGNQAPTAEMVATEVPTFRAGIQYRGAIRVPGAEGKGSRGDERFRFKI
nr:hypothetical protein [Bacillus pumilus]